MNRKNIITSLIIFILVFIGLSVYFIFPKSYIKFQTAPEKVAVLIDGKDKKVVTNGDSVFITPGKHNLVIFRDEFDPQTENIDIKNNETKEIVAALTPLTEAAKALLNNDKSNLVMEKATGIKMNRESELLKKNYPILSILPYSNPYYRITTCPSKKYPNDNLKIALCIDVISEAYKDTVYQEMSAAGYDLTSYEIIWTFNSD